MPVSEKELLPPIHPGEIIKEDVLRPLGMSVNRLALELRVPVSRLNEIVNGRRSITADTALRLGRYLGTSAQVWLNLQAAYELEVAERSSIREIKRQVHPRRDAA
jgi:addiction module HigA family antidote